MIWLLYLYVFALGTALGSFAMVVADRWGTKTSALEGRSKCDSCKKILKPLELIPIISWVAMQGQCRQCSAKIPPRYPIVEIASGLVLLVAFMWLPVDIITFNKNGSISSVYFSGIAIFILWCVIHTLCVVLILIDLKTMLMPYKYLFPLAGIALIYRIGTILIDGAQQPSILSLIMGLVIGGGMFGFLWIVSSGKWIGDSDVILGVIIALVVGGFIEVWIALVVASSSGLLYGVAVSKASKKDMSKMKIPFGPFLIAGMVVSATFSPEIIDFYQSTLLL